MAETLKSVSRWCLLGVWCPSPPIVIHFFIFFIFYNYIVLLGFLSWEIRDAFPRESQLRQSRATQPMVHTECFSVSIIHRTLTWTTGCLTCAQMWMHAVAHGGVRTPKESALKADSGRKIPCRTGKSNLLQRWDGPTLYQLSYIPTYHEPRLSNFCHPGSFNFYSDQRSSHMKRFVVQHAVNQTYYLWRSRSGLTAVRAGCGNLSGKLAYTQLVKDRSSTVVSARWATKDWPWPKE